MIVIGLTIVGVIVVYCWPYSCLCVSYCCWPYSCWCWPYGYCWSHTVFILKRSDDDDDDDDDALT